MVFKWTRTNKFHPTYYLSILLMVQWLVELRSLGTLVFTLMANGLSFI